MIFLKNASPEKVVAFFVLVPLALGLVIGSSIYSLIHKDDKISSYTQWNKDVYQINDTLFWHHKGDTVKINIKEVLK